MEKQNDNKSVKYALLATVIMSVVGILSGFLPVLSIMIYIVAVMFFICSRKYGFIFTLPFIIAVYVFVSFGISFSAAIGDILGPALAAALMGELSKLHRGQNEVLVKGILVAVTCNLFSLICMKLIDKTSVLTVLRENINTVVDSAVKSGEMTIYASRMFMHTYEIILQVIPAALIMMAILSTMFIYFFGCRLLIKKNVEIEKYTPFIRFSFPRGIIFGCIFIYVLGFIAGSIGVVDKSVILLNISLVVWVVFCIQGVAVLCFIQKLSKFPRVLFIILLCFLILSTIGTVVFFLVGMIDVVMNIREKIIAKRG